VLSLETIWHGAWNLERKIAEHQGFPLVARLSQLQRPVAFRPRLTTGLAFSNNISFKIEADVLMKDFAVQK